ncbi:hypothetical protein Egran_00374 [Elaphomyces granulatus]|uniref:GH16 domain-containing protein n=1 Tax=Elaphomyces granulatus TaxID=519963 RepID=A0A232M623_9EURO|nr:hypothetical protein Egran_00374 [Elaphomyces granulatus]
MEKYDIPSRNPFTDTSTMATTTTRPNSHRSSEIHSSVAARAPAKRKFMSYRLRGEYEKPWVNDKRLKRSRMGNLIIYGFIVGALLLSAWINYNTTKQVGRHDYCLLLDENFQNINPAVWNREVQVGGFGTGSFDWTTSDSGNSYTDSEGLHIVPSLTTQSTHITPAQIESGYTVNLTKAGGDGSCTGTTVEQCSVHSNSTLGVMIPSVQSARFNTKGKVSIKYGRVEVVAKFPVGDWLWPAIWMMPENDTYGPWPASGEIDIAESRGNGVDYPLGGRDAVSTTLHWGPTTKTDAYWRTSHSKHIRRTDFSKGFHTFGLEWSQDYLFTYLDNRLEQVLYWSFPSGQTMWQAGHFAGETVNQSLLVDPWSQTGRTNTPFDQPFYMILNVAVGSTNGFFPDGMGNKPWTDEGNAPSDFYKALSAWYPTWATGETRGMTVKSVKIWQEGTCSKSKTGS